MADRAASVVLPVFGVPVRFEADDAEILALVEESFGWWKEGEVDHAGSGLRVRLHRALGEELAAGRPEVRVRVLPDGRRMILSTAASVGIADPERSEAFGYLTRALTSDRVYARTAFIDALTLRLMGMRDRLPFHAAVVARGDAALLLTGPSGAGKSSLAYVCARAGLRVIAEDVAWVQREPALRVWGRSDRLHLPPQAADFFPELAGQAPVRRANQKEKIAVDLGALGALGVPRAGRVGVCLVSHDAAHPSLEMVDPDEAARALSVDLEPGFDLFQEAAFGMIRSLTAGGCWRLDAGPHPAGALALLEEAFGFLIGSSS